MFIKNVSNRHDLQNKQYISVVTFRTCLVRDIGVNVNALWEMLYEYLRATERQSLKVKPSKADKGPAVFRKFR